MAFSEQMPAWFDLTHEPVVGMASTVSTGTDRFSASGWENFGEMEMSREIGVAPHRVVDCYEDMYPEMASNWNGEGAVQSEYVHETQKEPGFMDLSYQTMVNINICLFIKYKFAALKNVFLLIQLPLAEIEADAVPHSPDISTLTTTSPTMKEPNSSVVKFKTTAAADLAINKHESSAVGAGSTKRYKCSFCPYSSDRKEICKRHAMTHTGEKLFQCFVCYKQFSRTDHCKKHLNRSSESVITCQCNDRLPILLFRWCEEEEKEELRNYSSWRGVDNWHLRRHLGTHIKPYSCDFQAASSERHVHH